MGNCNDILKRFLGVLVFCCSALVVFGEGSKDLYASGLGNRASLISTTSDVSAISDVSLFWPNPGRHFIYALPGEVIHVGSSAQGIGDGTINIWSPTGVPYTSGSSTTIGRITGRTEELTGPDFGVITAGYTSYNITVPSGQGGLWVVEFRAPVNTGGPANAPIITVGTNWTTANQQNNSRYILAWDATVVSGGVAQTGRVYQTAFTADLGSQDVRLALNAKFHVLSKDGYQYLVEPQPGFQPYLFAFFANNKGIRYNTGVNAGKSAYRSAPNDVVKNATGGVNAPYDYHIPTNDDDATNITHKLFYNTPSSILPETAPYYIGSPKTAWLRVAEPIQPVLSNLSVTGVEGTPNFGTGALTGGYVKFDANIGGSYRILIDANNDGDYSDAADVTLRGDAVAGANSVYWDGKDGQGNVINSGTNIQVNAVTLAGEIHFPLADAEKNVFGIKITRLATTHVASSTTVFWDDQLLPDGTGAASPKINTDVGAGQNSETNGHNWGTEMLGINSGSYYGNQVVMDTWANVFSAPQNLSFTVNVNGEADLEIVSLVGNLTNICVGTEVTYTFIARNKGPNNSGNATVSFVMPAELTTTSLVSATVTSGTATGVGGTFSGTTFIDVLSMDDDAEVTYVIKGTIASYPAGGNLNTSARILRAADVTDPDATNDDVAPPTDPTTECDGNPSGVGCNNIKNLTTVVQALPSNADAGPNQTKCNDGDFTMAAVTPAVGTGAWSLISGTATITNAALSNTTVTGVPVGTTATLRWTISNGTCTPTTADVTLTNNNPPSAAVLTTAATITNCGDGTFNIGAVTPTNGTGQWSVFSGTGTITNVNATSTTVTGVPNGSTVIIRWTVSSAGCTSNMTDVTLTNNPPVSTATLTTAATLTNCGDGTFNIGAVTPTVGTGQWSVFSGTALITDANLTSTTVTGVPNGSTAIIRWTVSSAGCTSSMTDVTVVNNNPPSAAVLTTAATLTNCGDGTFNIGAVTPTNGTGQWSVFSGTGTITNVNATSTTVTGVPNGSTVIIRWTVSSAGCTSNMTDVTLTNNPPVSTATLTTAATLTNCGDGTFNIGAVTPTVGTGQWSVFSGTALITDANLTSTTVTGVPNGSTAIIRWTVSSAGCTSSITDVTVVNNNPPSAAVLTTAATLTNCGDGTFNIGAVTPTNGTGQWSVFSGTGTITNANATSTTVTGVPNGSTVIIRWTVSSAGCTSNMTDVTLTNNPPVSAATLTTAATLTNCGDGTFNIGAVTPTVGTGQWSVFSGTAVITDANLTSTTVTGVPNGSTAIIRWTVSSAGCTSNMTDVTVVNNNPPAAAVLTTAATLTNCGNGTFNIGAVTPTNGTGQWSVFSGTGTITNANATSTTVTGVPNGSTVIIRWTVSSAGCTSNMTDVTLTNNPPVSTATLTTAATLTNCGDGTFNIGAVTPTNGTGQWSVFSGTGTITNVNATSTTVTGVPNGSTAIIRWTVSSAGCTSSMTDVTVVNNNPPSAAVLTTAATLTNCGNGTFNIGAVTPTNGTGQWSVFSGTGTITNANATSTTVTGVPNGSTVIIRWTVSSAGCTSNMTDVTLTNNPPVSTATLTTAATLTNCGDGTFNIGAVTPTVGTGQWSVFSGTGTITNVNATSTTVTGVPNGSTAIIRWTVSSAGCTSNMTDVTVVNNNPPSAAVLTTAATLTNCGNGTFNIGAVTPTNGTGQWSVFSGTGTITNVNATSTTVTGVPNGSTVIIRWTVSSAGCTSNMTDVTLTNNSGPSAATLTTAATLTNCNNPVFNIGAVTPITGTGVWTVISGTATIGNANATSTTVSNVTAGSTVVLRWTVSFPGCTSNTVDVTLVNNVLPSNATLVSPATLTNCNNGNFNIEAVAPTTGTGAWSVISGTATVANLTSTTTNVTSVGVGQTVVLRWTVSNGTCTPSTVDITLVNNSGPSAATLTTAATLTNCNNPVFNIGAVTPITGTGVWTVISGTATIGNANATSTTVSNVTAGSTVVLRWTVSFPGCTSNTVDVTLVNNALPSNATLVSGATLTNCNNDAFNIEAVVPTIGTGVWSVISGTATIANTTAASTQVTAVTAGTTVVLRWTVSNGTCTPTTVDITLVNNAGPSTATLTTAATLTNCNNPVFNIGAVTPITGTGVWTVISGTATIGNANATSTTVSDVTAGSTVVLRWTVSSPGCTSNTVDVTLVNNALPSNATLVSAATLTNCNNDAFNIEAVVPTIGTGVWSVISGTATIANTNAASTQVTAVTAGTTVVLRWTVSNGTCTPTTVDITLVNNNSPSTAIAGTNLVNCNNGTFTMAANSPVVGTGVWSLVSGTATITNIALTNTTVTSVSAGSNVTLRWTISAPGCTPSQSDIVLSNQLPTSVANAGANQINCNNGSFTMAALTPTAGTGNWSIVSGLATIVSSHLTNTMVTGVPVGTSTTLRWTITNGICPASTADVILTNAETVNAGSNIVISCTTTAKVPAALSGQTWTASGSNPSAASINNNGDITGLIKKGVYQFTLANANCSVTITVTKNNCPPVALNDTQTVRNDQVLTGTLKPKVSDPDSDVLILSLLVPSTRGTIVFNPDGTYTYTPPADYVGTDSITYRVCDADGLCADAKLYINITGAPKPPIAINDSTTTLKNTPVSGNVLGNDYNQGTNNNTGLTVTTTPVLPPVNGSVVLNADGSYTYTPANNFTGLDSFRYVICNAQALCDTATVYIRINEPPALQPKLEIEKRIEPKRIQYGTGETVTYTLVAKSTGNTTVNNISVQDILPTVTKISKIKIVTGSPTSGTASYEAITNIIFWSIPFLNAGDSALLKYTLVLADSGTLVNTATISSPMIPGVADTASLSIDVVNQADIKISKFLKAPAVISVNDEIGFTMIAENFGPAIGTEVVVQDSLYANLSDPRSMTVNIGKVSYDPVTRKITWRIDTLLVGQKDSLVIRVKVISGGQIRNGATVRAKQTDPVSGNNGSVVSNITGGQVLVEGKEFFIPSVFTPNGDGKNDKFTILGLNRFPGSELIIYNRWGNVVYQSKDYKNDWDGFGLNEATYYYTLNLKTTSGIQKMAGWVQILR